VDLGVGSPWSASIGSAWTCPPGTLTRKTVVQRGQSKLYFAAEAAEPVGRSGCVFRAPVAWPWCPGARMTNASVGFL